MAEIWLKKIKKEFILTIETTNFLEQECIDKFCEEGRELKITLKRSEYRQITILEIQKAVT